MTIPSENVPQNPAYRGYGFAENNNYISALSQTDVDLKTIQKISGHSSITTTMNIYAHTRESLVQEAGAKVGRLLS